MASKDSSSDFTPSDIQFTPSYHKDTYSFIDPTKFNLQGRSVLVTGASRGIGLCMALAYAKAGASQIAITARSAPSNLVNQLETAASSANKPKPQILPLSLDVTSTESIAKVKESIASHFGKLDILVNNAGVLEIFTPIADSDPDAWWQTMTTNLRGPYLLLRSFLPLLLSSANGLKTILNVSSVGALRQRPGASSYQTSKMALCRLSEFVNVEYGDKGVLCYSIHPGGVMTELAKAMPKETHGILTDTPELAGDSTVWLTAVRREWLAGRYVSVNWDMEEFEKEKERVEKGDLLKFKLSV